MRKLPIFLLLLAPVAAFAQSSSGLPSPSSSPPYTVWTPAQWTAFFAHEASKVDGTNGTANNLTVNSGTASGVSVTATAAGATALTGAQRAQKILTVDDFGAAGDGVTDDLAAFNAYYTYLQTQVSSSVPQLVWALGFGKKYYVSQSVNITGFTHYRFEGNGSYILSGDTTHPNVDMLGTDYSYLENLHVSCGSSGTPCLSGITFGVYNNAGPHSNITFNNVEVDGYYTQAPIQDSGSEIHLEVGVIKTNRYTTGTNSNFCEILDGTHHWPLDSRYVTDVRTADTFYSFNNQEIVGGSCQNAGDGSAIWDSGAKQHYFDNVYMQVLSAVPMAHFVFVTGAPSFYDIRWNVHSENGPSAIFQLDNPLSQVAAPVVDGLTIRDGNVQVSATGSMFKIGTNVTSAKLLNLDVYAPQWLNVGAVLLDTPADYTVMTGRYSSNAMTQFNSVTWSGWTTSNNVAAVNSVYGTGPIQAQVPDSTATGGNARGQNAVDFQTSRGAASQVASGQESTIVGGVSNNATAFAGVSGGNDNVNTATAGVAFGQQNQVDGNYSMVPGGLLAWTHGLYGSSCYATGKVSTLGDAQACLRVMRGTGATGSAIRVTSDGLTAGATNCINLSHNTAYAIKDLTVVALDHTTVSKSESWSGTWTGLLTQAATVPTTALAISSTPTPLTNGTLTGSSISVAADTSNGCLNVSFTPPTSNTDTWNVVATIETVEVQ